MTGLARGTDSSAGFGEAVLACGGLCVAALPDENLDEMLENQEPLRCGAGADLPPSGADLAIPGRAAAVPFPPVTAVLPVALAAAPMLAADVAIDVPEIVAVSRRLCEGDLRRTEVFVSLSNRASDD